MSMRIKGLLAAGVVAAGVVAAGGAAFASTEEAWQEFRDRTEAACLALLPEGAAAEIAVDPFGSQSYGIAMLHMTEGPEAGSVMVCVMEKQGGAAELSGAFAPRLRLAPQAAE